MDIHLDKHSFVDRRTGEATAPSEFLQNLRGIEATIAQADDDIARLKSELKAGREAREILVAQLRGAIRDGVVLPLFDGIDDEPAGA